jgi:hypothetical protein
MNDYTGITTISGQMQAQLRQLDPEYKGGSGFYIGSSHRGKTFVWTGVKWNPIIVLIRFCRLGVAVLLTLVAAGLFDRFDPAGEIVSLKRRKKQPALPKLEELERLYMASRTFVLSRWLSLSSACYCAASNGGGIPLPRVFSSAACSRR